MTCDCPTYYNPTADAWLCMAGCGFSHKPTTSKTLERSREDIMSTETLETLGKLPYTEVVGFGDILVKANAFISPLQVQSYYTTPQLYDYAYSYWMGQGKPELGSENWQGFVDFLASHGSGVESDPQD